MYLCVVEKLSWQQCAVARHNVACGLAYDELTMEDYDQAGIDDIVVAETFTRRAQHIVPGA